MLHSKVGNYNCPEHPDFQDFGDATLLTDNGATFYCRVDWFTPQGLGSWGDGRTIILGTDGYIELRKYLDVARDKDERPRLSRRPRRASTTSPSRQGRLSVLRPAHPRLPRPHGERHAATAHVPGHRAGAGGAGASGGRAVRKYSADRLLTLGEMKIMINRTTRLSRAAFAAALLLATLHAAESFSGLSAQTRQN